MTLKSFPYLLPKLGNQLPKNGPNFSKSSALKLNFSKNDNNKKHAPKLIFFNEKKIEKDSDNF